MKKFLFVLLGVFAFSGAFAAGENIPTSKSYVDAAVAQKQDKISASIIMPAGYTQLQYIESTGTQYIDTGIVAKSGLNTKIKLSIKDANSGCALGTNSGGQFHPAFWYNGNWDSIIGLPDQRGGAVIPNTEYITEFNSNENGFRFYVDGVLKNSGTATHAETGNLWMFSRSGSDRYPMRGKIFYVQIYNNNILVRDFIPARRDSDNVVGMYDTVTGQFFTNSGTGEFIAGLVITPGNQVLTNTGTAGEYGTKGIYDANGEYATQTQNLVDAATMNAGVQNAIDSEFQCIEWLDPNDHTSDCLLLQLGGITEYTLPTEYTQLQYIESTGTQYIDTGIVAKSGLNTKIKLSIKDANSGCALGTNSGGQFHPAFWYSGNWDSIIGLPDQRGGAVIPNTEYITEFNSNENGFRFYVDGVLKNSGTATHAETGNLWMFSRSGSKWYPMRGKIFYVQIYDNNILVRDFIPARRNSDGVFGMYDTVSNTFFTNSGTGEFIAGPVATNMYLPAGN